MTNNYQQWAETAPVRITVKIEVDDVRTLETSFESTGNQVGWRIDEIIEILAKAERTYIPQELADAFESQTDVV